METNTLIPEGWGDFITEEEYRAHQDRMSYAQRAQWDRQQAAKHNVAIMDAPPPIQSLDTLPALAADPAGKKTCTDLYEAGVASDVPASEGAAIVTHKSQGPQHHTRQTQYFHNTLSHSDHRDLCTMKTSTSHTLSSTSK